MQEFMFLKKQKSYRPQTFELWCILFLYSLVKR